MPRIEGVFLGGGVGFDEILFFLRGATCEKQNDDNNSACDSCACRVLSLSLSLLLVLVLLLLLFLAVVVVAVPAAAAQTDREPGR